MLARILEPEVMDTPEEAHDYDTMDHAAVNRVFVEDFLKVWTPTGRVLDVGTGTAQIPIEFCRQSNAGSVVAIDLAEEMLILARRNVTRANLEARIQVERVNARGMPFPDGSFEAAMSNSIIHHIPEPALAFAEISRVCINGGRIFVRDLLRPSDDRELHQLVKMYACDANDHQRKMFADSLHAALTVDEVRAMIAPLGFAAASVQQTSDRHWTWSA